MPGWSDVSPGILLGGASGTGDTEQSRVPVSNARLQRKKRHPLLSDHLRSGSLRFPLHMPLSLAEAFRRCFFPHRGVRPSAPHSHLHAPGPVRPAELAGYCSAGAESARTRVSCAGARGPAATRGRQGAAAYWRRLQGQAEEHREVHRAVWSPSRADPLPARDRERRSPVYAR